MTPNLMIIVCYTYNIGSDHALGIKENQPTVRFVGVPRIFFYARERTKLP